MIDREKKLNIKCKFQVTQVNVGEITKNISSKDIISACLINKLKNVSEIIFN